MTRHIPYITIQEAARALNKSDKTLRRWIATVKLPSKRAKNGRILVQVEVEKRTPASESVEERLAALEARAADLENVVVTLTRQPRPMRKLGTIPR